MEEREGSESENPPILKPSNKYKEDNPQAPDKSEVKALGRKKAFKRNKRQQKQIRKQREDEDEDEVSESSDLDPNPESSPHLDSETKTGLTCILLRDIAFQIRDFSDEKVIDYKQIAESSSFLEDGYKCKEIYSDYRNKLLHPRNSSEFEKDCRKSLCESFPQETQRSFPSRLKIYQQKTGNILQKEEKFTHGMIDSYLKLTNPSSETDQLDEFARLCSINERFLDYLKKEDQGGTTPVSLDSYRKYEDDSPSKTHTYLMSPRNSGSSSGPPFNPELYKELRKFENERLQKLGALVADGAIKMPKFSELEIANLLRGIYKYGESQWKDILTEEKFDKSRTVNQLILKWRMIKILMKGELDSMNVKRQKLITRNDWILAAIKALEKRNKVHRDLPHSTRKSYELPFFKKQDKRSDNTGNMEEPGVPKSKSLMISNPDNIPLFLIKQPSDDEGEGEGDGESEESECPDYFAGINFEKKHSTVQVPPQNYIKHKNREMFKNKGGSRSFFKSKPKPQEKDDFNIELI